MNRPLTLITAAIFGGLLAACITDDSSGSNGSTHIAPGDTIAATWSSHAMDYREENGQRFAYDCPAEGDTWPPVWGTDTYTDDSSVCKAAVHAGKISFTAGGVVVIEIRPGEESYEGTLRNEVQTSDWPSWPGSFVFP